MQPGEDQLDHGGVFLGVQADGNAAAVVLDGDAAIDVQRDQDLLAVAGQGLVRGVVYDFLHDVQGFSVRVYMPGRCRTGSSPFRTRMDASL